MFKIEGMQKWRMRKNAEGANIKGMQTLINGFTEDLWGDVQPPLRTFLISDFVLEDTKKPSAIKIKCYFLEDDGFHLYLE